MTNLNLITRKELEYCRAWLNSLIKSNDWNQVDRFLNQYTDEFRRELDIYTESKANNYRYSIKQAKEERIQILK